MSPADDDELLAEQRDFYRADAEAFDEWLESIVDETNDDPTAVGYREGRALIASVFGTAPLGRTLEIAAGTGRLAQLHVPHASSTTLLDSSPEMLALAARRLGSSVRLVEADVFAWEHGGEAFDTIVFSAWLHHVPLDRFDAFWRTIASLLAPGGRVLFDFPDARVEAPGAMEVPAEPTDDYGFYKPVDGISTRDHFGRRWRVVHNLWDPDDLAEWLAALGWSMRIVGPGLFGNVVWAEATRSLGTRASSDVPGIGG